MKRNNSTRHAVGAIICAAALLTACTAQDPTPAARARLAAVEEAVHSAIPAVTRLDDDASLLFRDEVHAQQASSGRHVCYLMVLRQLHDWSQVE